MKTKTNTPKIYTPEIEGEKDFYDAIHRSMKTYGHEYALREIIKEFERYKKYMSGNLVSSEVPSESIFLFRFEYQLKENVWKDVEIYGDQTLESLAKCIIKNMGWRNDHLDAFFFPEKKDDGVWEWYTAYEIGSDGVDNDQFPILHTEEVLVSSIDYRKHKKIGFVFDFGDDHRFLMEYKGVRKFTKEDKRKNFPKVVDQRGVPPEQYPEWKE